MKRFNQYGFLASAYCVAAWFRNSIGSMFLKRKLMVIPDEVQQMKQQCNAEALKQMGVPQWLKELRKKRNFRTF